MQRVPPWQIPFAFFATSIATLGAALLWTAIAPPPAFVLLHLLVLGVFATTAMGALYQFVPVVGMAPLRFSRLPYAHLALAIAGTALVAYGFDVTNLQIVLLGGALHTAGAILELTVLLATLRGSKNAGMPSRLATAAFAWLLATFAAGMAVAHGTLAPGVHGIIGLAGFFGTLITAVTFRLLKMFERVNVETRAPLRAIFVTVSALVTVFWPHVGAILLAIAAAIFVADLFVIAAKRNPAYQRETLFYSLISGFGGLFAAAGAAFGCWYEAIVLAVWFFTGCAVAGYIQRIVPFIWWIRRSHAESPKNVPLLEQLTSPLLGVSIVLLWSAAGLWWFFAPFTRGPAIVALCAYAALLAQLSRIHLNADRIVKASN